MFLTVSGLHSRSCVHHHEWAPVWESSFSLWIMSKLHAVFDFKPVSSFLLWGVCRLYVRMVSSSLLQQSLWNGKQCYFKSTSFFKTRFILQMEEMKREGWIKGHLQPAWNGRHHWPWVRVSAATWCCREYCPPCSMRAYTCRDLVLRCPQSHSTFCTCGQWMTRILNRPTLLTTPPPTLPSCTGTPLKEGRRSTCRSCLRAWKSRRASRIKRTSSTTSTHICQWLFIPLYTYVCGCLYLDTSTHVSVAICSWIPVHTPVNGC